MLCEFPRAGDSVVISSFMTIKHFSVLAPIPSSEYILYAKKNTLRNAEGHKLICVLKDKKKKKRKTGQVA